MLVFDMDGVLVEVSESYRETIVQTVKIFTGKTISRELIQEYKNRGGYNNDWISIAEDLPGSGRRGGLRVHRRDLHGPVSQPGSDPSRALDSRGRLAGAPGTRYELAIFTGRSTMEAEITLDRQGLRDRFLLVTPAM